MWKEVATSTCSIALIAVAAVPGFAQSDERFAQSDNHARLEARHLSLPATATRVMRVYERTEPAGRFWLEPPANLTFPEMYRELIETMMQRSPTFRRQCLRVARAQGLRVHLRSAYPANYSTPRARTDIVRTGHGGMVATVTLQRVDALPELIAHELEHVIEQIDGVDLRLQSLRPGTGVRDCGDGSFETIRAERIGAMVAQETRDRR
jgi:hypothetical protein